MTRAQWAQGIPDIITTPGRITEFLTSGQLSDATGLAENTLLDRLTRKPITRKDSPRGALCRPAARLGDLPLWSPEQLAEYHARIEARNKREQELPVVTPAQARERHLYSTFELAEMLGLHDQTLRRAQGDDEDYPDVVATRSRDGRPGVPEHVRELGAVLEWAHGRGYAVPPKVAALVAEPEVTAGV